MKSNIIISLSFSALCLLAIAVNSQEPKDQKKSDASSTNSASVEADAKLSPMALIKRTVGLVIETNRKFSGESNTQVRREKLREIINPHFDFNDMAKRSLGAHWESCSEEERSEFVSVFSNLLARTYLERIDTVTENIVGFADEKITPPKALVKTVINHRGDSFPIDYKLANNDGKWRVYDVVIENIGLVANYRNEFAGIIRKEKFVGLMDKLKSKSSS
jgi:phospholipid transport system substrate-binding protein